MRWVVFCWSRSDRIPAELRADDIVVCADSGLEYARRCGVAPSVLIGDFDSYRDRLPEGCEILRLPPEKDDTDTMFAVRTGLARGYRDFLICGGFGGRSDHFAGAIQTLNFLVSAGASAALSDGYQYAEILQGPCCREYRLSPQKYFSVLALSPKARGVTLSGMKYPLFDAELSYDFPLGVSNELSEPTGTVSLQEGRILILRSDDSAS